MQQMQYALLVRVCMYVCIGIDICMNVLMYHNDSLSYEFDFYKA